MRPTKDELKQAIRPLRETATRYACGLMTEYKAPKHTPIQWRNVTIDIQLVKRGRVVCNVPAPFNAFHFMYSATVDGVAIAYGETVASFVDNLFRYSFSKVQA